MLRGAPLPTPAPPARPAAARAPRTGTGRVRAARGRAFGSAQRQRRRQQRQQQGRQRQQQEEPLPARASVLVCREAGKNGALLARLRAAGVKGVAEVPLIEHAEGEDVRQLPGALAGDAWAWVAGTTWIWNAFCDRGDTSKGFDSDHVRAFRSLVDTTPNPTIFGMVKCMAFLTPE